MPDDKNNDFAPSTRPSSLAAERTAHRAALAARPSGRGRSVLVVDFSPIARKFLMSRLEEFDYGVVGVGSGEEAVRLVEKTEFAIVFTEFLLADGGMDGLSVCKIVKEQASAGGPAVVIATGRASASDRVRGALAGCDAYLTKPLSEAHFIAALAEVDPVFR